MVEKLDRFPVWCAWHNQLLAIMTKAEYEERCQKIEDAKPSVERPLRQYLMRKVRGELPAEVVKAYEAREKARVPEVKAYAARVKADSAWDKAHAAQVKAHAAQVKANSAWDKAHAAQVKAQAVWVKTIRDNLPTLEALHRQEVPDTTWDGKTIFSKGWEKHPHA